LSSLKTHLSPCSGTLMAREVLFRVLFQTSRPGSGQVQRITVQPAVLHDFRRQRVRGADFPAIVPKRSATVRGAFITGLTEIDVSRLDLFEGSMYHREKVKVKLLKNVSLEPNIPDSNLTSVQGEEVEAETYVWQHPTTELEDGEWDFDHFRKRKMRAWMGEPELAEDAGTYVDEGFAAADAVGAGQASVASTSGRQSRSRGSGDRGRGGGAAGGRGAGDRNTRSPGSGDRGAGAPKAGSPSAGDRAANVRGAG